MSGDAPMPTPKKSMAELQAMTKLELIQLVVERAVALQSLESKCQLLEHTKADAVNHAFLGLLKRLGIKPDRDKLTEDDMHRLITPNLLGWEFPSDAEVACLLTEAERVRALGPRPDYICSICGKPIDRCQAACSLEASRGSLDHIEFHQECWDAEYGPWPPTEQMMRAAQSRHRRNH